MLVFMLSLIICGNMFGQSVEYRKPVVLINYFKGIGDVDTETTEAFRMSYVTESKKVTERIQFIDVSTEDMLSEEQKRRMRDDALDDVLAKEMVQLNVDYILDATITKAVIEKKQDKKGNVTYAGKLNYTVNVVSTEDGTVVFTEEDVVETIGKSSAKEAETKLLTGALVTCGVIESVAHLRGEMIETDYVTDKKGHEITKCYVNLGAIHGTKKGDDFVVMAATKLINGHPVYDEIGEVEIMEVMADDLSECKVKKSGEDILKYMKEYLDKKTSNPEQAAILRIESKCSKSKKELEVEVAKGINRVQEGKELIEGLFKVLGKKKK